jgi:hypothetical protein
MELNSATPLLRNLKLSVLLSAVILFSCPGINGQERTSNTPPLKERLFYGGNIGLQFGSITDIEFSPVIGLWVLPRLAFAAGPDYRYYKERDYATALYGGSCYAQFVVIKDIKPFLPIGSNTGIFLHVEDELLSLKTSFWKNPPYSSDRFYVNTVLAGAGISQHMGRRASFDIIVLWPLNESEYSIYSKPEIRVNFIF